MNHSLGFNSRVHKEKLIHPSDRLIGTVPLVCGRVDRQKMEELLNEVSSVQPNGRKSVIKTWVGLDNVEVYLSTRVSAR